jgi:hypothetical protein
MRKLIFVLLLISGCKSEHTSDVSSDSLALRQGDSATTTANNDDVITPTYESGGAFEFVNDEVGGDPFEEDFETMMRSVGKYDVLKKPFQNLHDSTKMDTLMTFNFGMSAIEYFRGETSGFIISADIQSDRVQFKKGIVVGMDQKDFNALFDELKAEDTFSAVTITTTEGLAYSDFLFANGKLTTIKYQSYFD